MSFRFDGLAAARIRGEENADEIRLDEYGNPSFLSNNAGGILGGIQIGYGVGYDWSVVHGGDGDVEGIGNGLFV